jgi:peptidoglycan/xylan/chitin deacetylase (PgdA/CDA1 family)
MKRSAPPTKSKQRTKKKQHRLSYISPFAVICAVLAIGYIGWRLWSFVGPDGLGVAFANETKPVAIGCSEDVDLERPIGNEDDLPVVSSHYQQYIRSQKAIGDNLVKNSTLQSVDSTGSPAHYYTTAVAPYLKYSYTRDTSSNTPFLRVETQRDLTDKDVVGGWLTDVLPISLQATYVYSLEYRSSVPATVSVEYTMPDGSLSYRIVTDLKAEDKWQSFTDYFTNRRGATAARFIITSRAAGQIDTRNYMMHQIAGSQLDAGMVSVTFDDGWQSIADKAIPLLNRYGIPTTQYVISDASDKQVPLYMNVKTLQAIKAAGHEIGSHTLTHCDQTKLTAQQVADNARDSKNNLAADGLGPITSYAYPYGRYSDMTQPLVAQSYPYMRSSDVGYNDRYFDNRNIKSMVVLSTTTDETFQSWLDYAKANKVWLVIAYHRVDESGEYSVTSSQLKKQLDMIKASNLNVETLSKAAASIR